MMKKRMLSLFMVFCLLLTACGGRGPQDIPEGDVPVSDIEQENNETQEDTPQLPQDGGEEQPPVDEENNDGGSEEEKKEEETQTTPKYDPLVPVKAANERVANAAAKGLSAGMEQIMLDMMDCYYRTLSDLSVKDCSALFTTKKEADWHKAIWYSMVQVRKAALIDLHLVHYKELLS